MKAPTIAARVQPHALPAGWYVVAFSSELARGQQLTRAFFGGEVVVFRTESGRVSVTQPFCPHLGAHLGHGGVVDGETLRCPFHGFRFDVNGTCVAGYASARAPKRCQLPIYPTREKNGQVLAYFHPRAEAPSWEIPDLDLTGFRRERSRTWQFASHPQETSENSVDIGHFAAVHGYDQVDTLEPMATHGPQLRGKYRLHRRRAGLSKPLSAEFEIHVWGLGYSFVDVHVPAHALQMHMFVFSTPAQQGRIDLRIALSLRSIDDKRALHPLAALAPRRLLEPLLERAAFRAYAADVRQDFDIWSNKTYLERPGLADGDGPIGLYRKWAKQFYLTAGDEILSIRKPAQDREREQRE
jgi:phenylpropionate dioxygenase-like ring-hydroxylating dioxygenase large terminal subunit